MVARNKRTISLKDFYIEFLKHTSNSFPKERQLTEMEVKVLTEFWALEGDLVSKYRFSAAAKRYVREDVFGFKNYSSLDNYITSLVKKGYLQRVDGNLVITPMIDLPKQLLKNDGRFVLVYEFDLR